MAIVVEVLNRSGLILHTHRYQGDTVKIGRSFDSDLILHDPHIEADHLEITLDTDTTNLYAKDCNSRNGTWLAPGTGIARTVHFKQKQPVLGKRLFYSGQTFLVGRTILRVFHSSHLVPEAVPLSPWESIGYRLAYWWVWGSVLLSIIVLQSLNAYLHNPAQKNVLQYILPSGFAVIGALLFAGFWAFVGRNLKHEAKFSVHFSVALMGALALALFDMVLPVITFNLELGWIFGMAKELANAGVIFVVSIITLIYATSLKPVVRSLVALVIPLAIVLSVVIEVFTRPEFINAPSYDTALVTPPLNWRGSQSAQEFVEQASTLYSEPEQ